MIAVDTNILIYAHREDSPFYESASGCMRKLAEGRTSWAIPWPCLHEFVAVATHPRIYAPPSTTSQALTQVEKWMESPTLELLSEAPGHWETLRRVLVSSRISGAAIHDARVFALCLQYGVREFWSADRDFGRFAGLKVRNPLIDK